MSDSTDEIDARYIGQPFTAFARKLDYGNQKNNKWCAFDEIGMCTHPADYDFVSSIPD